MTIILEENQTTVAASEFSPLNFPPAFFEYFILEEHHG
jgi:hypothetical protein